MKSYKPKTNLKTSQEVREFSKEKEKEFVIPYKGGHGLVVNGSVKVVFVGKESLKQAKKFNK